MPGIYWRRPVPKDLYQRFYDAYAPAVARHPLWKRLTRTAFSAKVTKYALGSVIAFVLGNIAFAFCYWMNLSTTICSIVGFVVAAIPNWILNRRWAWQQSGRPPVTQVVAYFAVSAAVVASSSWITGWTNDQVQNVPQHYGLRLLIVTGSYIAVTVFFFFFKFALYEFWIFADRRRTREALSSLRQVTRIARANRIP
jgi:putative flippase GtrA